MQKYDLLNQHIISGFTDQLNLLAEAFHKYEIDEVGYLDYFKNNSIGAF